MYPVDPVRNIAIHQFRFSVVLCERMFISAKRRHSLAPYVSRSRISETSFRDGTPHVPVFTASPFNKLRAGRASSGLPSING